MNVIFGSARIDERGNIVGGLAGDQTGKEVATEPWYNSSKGWVTLRAKDKEVAKKIAYAMKRACDNSNIGYDQYQRNSLYVLASKVDFDPGKVSSLCETDCSALVRVCLAYAGILTGDFNTSIEKNVILSTGKFTEVATSKETALTGDILVTKTQGHTVVVVSSDNDKEESSEPIVNTNNQSKKKGVIEEMQCTFEIDKNGTTYWFDGKQIHTLTHPDQLVILKKIYEDNNGKAMPHYNWSSKAPWHVRLKQAIDGKAPKKF